jgi:peptidoglycan/LPS O-acetylase OafA/YrhL
MHPKYRPDIDGLRAIAVLSVIGFHAFPGKIKGGFIGVDIFFVISGFLISTIIFENIKAQSFSFTEFYYRRIKRIFPALIVVLVSSFVFGWFGLLADEYKQLSKHIVGGGLFVSNLVLWNEAGYFDNASNSKPLLHLWSLGIEEQFYFIWPLLLWFGYKRNLSFLITTLVVAVISFAINIWELNHNPVADFYSPLARFWELLIGAGLAYYLLYFSKVTAKFSNRLRNSLSAVGLTFIVIAIVVLTKASLFPGWWALLPTAGAALIILAGPYAWINSALLSSRILVWFGLISYPLYLWHWPVLSFMGIVLRDSPSRLERIVAVLLSIILAWLTYRYIEKPIKLQKKNISIYLCLAMMGIVIVGFLAYQSEGVNNRSALKNISLNQVVRDQFMGPLWKYTKNDLCLDAYPNKEAENYAWWFCMKNKDQQPSVIILGDSRANQLYPGFIKNKNFESETFLSIGTCDFSSIVGSDDIGNPCYSEKMFKQRNFIDEIIIKSKSIKWAIVNLSDDANKPTSQYIASLSQRIGFLEKNNVQVIIFTPDPRIGFNPKACFSTPLNNSAKDCSFSKEKINQISLNYALLVESIKNDHPNVHFFSPNEIFCNANECSYLLEGMPLYRDETHMSEFASIRLQDYFMAWAQKNKLNLFQPQ